MPKSPSKSYLSLGLLAGLLMGASAPAPPKRIVSLNLCADQYLLALANRGQIAALTRFARDPTVSAAAGEAAGFSYTGGSAEEVLALRPDLVISGGTRPDTIAALRQRGIPILEIPWERSVSGTVSTVTRIAAAIGQPRRGAALIARMQADLAKIDPHAGKGRTAAYYQRRGYLTGTGTLVDEMMRRVGLVNLAARLHRPALSRLSIEEIALARPDYLILERDALTARDQGTAMLQHPVLERAVPPRRRLSLPQAYTVCGGPAFVKGVALLARQLEAAR